MGPILVAPLLVAATFLIRLAVSFRDFIEVAGDRRLRVIHGIEHATIAVLRERGFKISEGSSVNGGFSLTSAPHADNVASIQQVRRATLTAASRVRRGEHQLVYARDCGTSWIVSSVLVAIGLLILGPLALWARVGLAGLFFLFTVGLILFFAYADDLGLLAQKHITVSHDFKRIHVNTVTRGAKNGRARYCVDLKVNL